MRLPRAGLLTLVSLLVGLTVAVAPAPAASAASAGWADLSFSGKANDWTGTLRQRATGFPEATVVSDSTSGSATGRQSGSSTYLSAATPVGEVYGSSRDRPYLNLRPYTANGSGAPGSSTTTYAFAAPTPASGWTFVLGDVDADAVTVRATGPGGVPVKASDLGFRSVFNYCGGSVCTANDDVPSWDETTATLTGNADRLDTSGASAWFEPRVPFETLTFAFARRAGFPVYQAWFASQSHTLTGTVDAPGDVREGLTVKLFAPDGRVVGETTTDADGRYRFGDLATYDGYRVSLVRPTGYTSDDPLTRTVDLGDDDQVADFSLRAIVPVAVSGTVRDEDGNALPGVEVRVTGPGPDLTVVTGADGGYVFDQVPPGSYDISAVPPAGLEAPALLPLTVPDDSEQPIDGQDLTFSRQPSGTASGTVTFEGGDPAAGVRVTVTRSNGDEQVAVTDADGRWTLDDIAQGDYLVAVVPPPGIDVVGRRTAGLSVPPPGGTFGGLDFVLEAPVVPATYSAGGTVVDEAGMAFPGVEVTVLDPDGEPFDTVTTGQDGTWQVDGLLPGDGWTAEVEPPDDYGVDGESELTFDVTDADTTGLDFVLVDQGPSGGSGGGGSEPAEGSSAGSGSSSPVLAHTGGPDLALLLVGLGATAGGVLLLRRRTSADR